MPNLNNFRKTFSYAQILIYFILMQEGWSVMYRVSDM